MTSSKTVAEARRLLNENQVDEARELLLREGYVDRADAQVQAAYESLIPVTPQLQEQLDGVLAQLQDADPRVRKKAANSFRRIAMKATSVILMKWMRDPRTTGRLIAALDDADPACKEESAGALAWTIWRYFPDLRAFEPLSALLSSSRKETRFYATLGIGWLNHPQRWKALLPMFSDKSEKVRQTACKAVVFNAGKAAIDAATKQQLRERLTACLTDTDVQVRTLASNGLHFLGA